MKKFAGLLVVIGLAVIGIAVIGVHSVDAEIHHTRLTVQAQPSARPTTTAGIQNQINTLEQGSKVLDKTALQMKVNERTFLTGLTCLAVGVCFLIMPRMLRMVQSTGMISTEQEGK